MLHWLNTPTALIEDSAEYLWIYFAGLVFVLIYNTGASILRSLGDAKSPFIYLIICCVINVVLDYVLIVYGHMGIAGASAATVIAQAISAVLVTIRLMRFREVCDFRMKQIRVHKKMLKRELMLGLPGGVQSAMYCISGLISMAALNAFGETPVASWTAFSKFDALFWMISGAMGVTITTFVGQNFGAGNFDRIHKGVRIMNWTYVFVALASTVLFIVFRVQLFRIFVESQEAIDIGCRMLMIIGPFYILNIHIENYSGALRGVGDTVAPMMISIFGVCVFRVIYLTVLMPIYNSLDLLCLMYPISWAITNTLYLIYYPIRMRKLVKV
jgi:putative MATE family efflux protein